MDYPLLRNKGEGGLSQYLEHINLHEQYKQWKPKDKHEYLEKVTFGNRFTFGRKYTNGQNGEKYTTFGTSPDKINKGLYERNFEKELIGKHSPPALIYASTHNMFDQASQKYSHKSFGRQIREF